MLRVKSGLVAVLCVLLTAPFASVASGQEEPSTGSLVGTWEVSFGGIEANLDNGAVTKVKTVDTWTIEIQAGNILRIGDFNAGPNATIYATYEYGILFIGVLDEGMPYGHSGYAIIQGKPGKLCQFQGEFIGAGAGDWDELHAGPIKGKQISTSILLAPAVGGADVSATVAAAKPPPTPPSAAELLGTYWIVKVSGKGYEFSEDAAYSVKGQETWHFTPGGDPDEFVVETRGSDGDTDTIELTYFEGILFMADGNDTDPATAAGCAYMQVSGTPGAMKLTGQYAGYEIGGSEDYVESAKLSGKQIPPPPI